MIPLEYTISEGWGEQPVSELLGRFLGFSTAARKLLRETPGALRLDGQPVAPYERVSPGQRLTVLLPDDPPSPIEPVQGPLDIRYEDSHLLVVSKAPGVTVHPGPNHHGDTLGNFVTWHYRSQGENHLFRPVNRLDKGTSGLMCIAKHGHAADRLRAQLHSPAFRRVYLAVCEGVPVPPAGVIDAPIGRKEGSVIARQVRPGGKEAATKYQIIISYVNLSLVKVWPQTGRTHQIRVHLAYIGHPLVGDFLYGSENPGLISRPALHSAELTFVHPVTGERLSFADPLPEDMRNLLR